MQANIVPQPLDGVQRSKQFFSEEGHVAYQITRKEVWNIMQVKCLTLCSPLMVWVAGKKVRHRNCADKYILIDWFWL